MKVGFFTDSYFPEIDGVTYTLKLWKQKLEERGHEVHIFYPGSSDYEPVKNEHPVFSVSNPFYNGYNVPLPLKTGIPELDIVHCHTPLMMGVRGRAYAWRHSIPSVYTHHTPLEEYFVQATYSKALADILGNIYVPLENQLLKSFDTVTSNTEETNRNVETVELPVGIDLEFFSPTKGKLLDELGVDTSKPVIGYSGRLSSEKNVGTIIELAENTDASFLIVGEGPEKESLVEKAGDNVYFSDFLEREKLPVFYTQIDLFVTASTGDTLGLSTLEANACGTPVVAPDVYPFNDTITNGNGLRYSYGNMEDFKQKAVEALGSSRDTREAVKKYSLEETIDRLEKKYSELVER